MIISRTGTPVRCDPRRVLRRAAVLTAVAVLALAGAESLAAAGAAPAPPTVTRHPERDWLGSQAAKHFGGADRQAAVTPAAAVAAVPGLDVSSWQGNVGWAAVAKKGAKFAIVKATESTDYQNPYFSQQYTGAYDAGLVHGAYHFATPDTSSGAAQATYFAKHGGGWSKDGKTFPGMLDIEWNPYGSTCYGKSKSAMTSWIKDFSDTYHSVTKRWPMIYTANGWWSQCVGTAGDFSSTNPLVLACYCSSAGTMPHGWSYQTIWQYADSGTFPGDQDRFNGSLSRVKALADG
ncbi:Lyzozyme M1 (1,4-beta-N-acetylmuramidase), GH25 family [Jatrophihabitans endophyticus]|uniref:Lysozyme n=1 Tax=Jatrophihabitans endophyticus TaxID=1206085 RepID=A0A1M5K3P1_9ACTN|nr:lysozyme [Jatrophihabitans endophyticus]SHG47220.1 Lyzozyme M1 (1,4-beta-N-acetylmuramidase), GH25 family [Jatrophihabitans endophyticus]